MGKNYRKENNTTQLLHTIREEKTSIITFKLQCTITILHTNIPKNQENIATLLIPFTKLPFSMQANLYILLHTAPSGLNVLHE